jgi:hypothetical protein
MIDAGAVHRRELETIPFALSNLSIQLCVTEAVAAVVRRRYRGFTHRSSVETAAPQLRLVASGTGGTAADSAPPRVSIAAVDPFRVALEGEYSGHLDVEAGLGMVEGPDPARALDMLLRLALALFAPSRGWVLMHGAAIAMHDGTWALLIGESGAGKSTAARAFRSFCDELVLVHPHLHSPSGPIAASTPYWHGRPGSAPCGALVCLKRDGNPRFRQVRGVDAVRLLAPHVIRPVRLGSIERTTVEALCGLARQIPVFEISCPTGPGYLPHLEQALGLLGCSLPERRRRKAGAA